MTRSSRARTVIGLVVAFAFAVPLVAMLSGSFREPGRPPPRALEIVPDPVSTEGYRDAFGAAPLGRAIVFVPLAVYTSSRAGLAIALAGRTRRARLLGFVLLVLMLPVTAVWIPRFVMFEALGFVGTYVPLVAPALAGGSAFFVLLYAVAFLRIPRDVLDAARLEGASPGRIWARVAMPMARGTTVAVSMLAFALSWGNFIDALLYLQRESTYTAPLALRYLEQLGPTNWPVLLAGSVAVTAPVVVAFAIAERWFLSPGKAVWLAR